MEKGKQISTKQFIALEFLVSIAIKMFMLPALILRTIGKDGYLVLVAYIIFEFVSLTFLLIVAKRNPDKTLFGILQDTCGKVVSRIIVGIMVLFLFVKSVIVTGEIKIFFNIIMYRDINWAVLILPLLALAGAFAVRPLRAMGRTAELIAPIVFLATLVLTALLFGELQFDNLLPFLSEGIQPVAKGIITFPMWFCDVTVMTLFFGNVKISKGFVVGTYVAKLVSSLLIMIFSVVLFSAYANISTLIDYGNNVSNMTQLSLGSQEYGRFDLLFYCIWLLSVFIKFSALFTLIVRSIKFIVVKGSDHLYACICALALYVVCVFVFNNEESVFLFATGIAKFFIFPVAYVLPLFLMVSAFIKYKSNYHDLPLKSDKGVIKCKNK